MKSDNKKHKLTPLRLSFLFFLIVASVYILTQNRQNNVFRNAHGKIFGTYYNIKYEHTEPLDSVILSELTAVDLSLSMFNKSSNVAKINANQTVVADSMFQKVFLISNYISRETKGDFDVTVAPLVNLWGFGFEKSDSVTPSQIDSIMDFVGYDKIKLNGNIISKSDSRVKMDFSAVAKGFAVDKVAEALTSRGVKNYMVEIGGEIIVRGLNSKGKKWIIEITKPCENEKAKDASKILLDVKDVAMATSGNYRRFYVRDGKKYAHTIDGHTGYPVQHSLLSATVLASTCAEADAYATSFMVMGVENAKRFLANRHDLSAYLIYIDAHGNLQYWMSDSMVQYIKKRRNDDS